MFRTTPVNLLALVGLVGCYSPPGEPWGPGANPEAIDRTVIVPGGEREARARVGDAFAELGFAPVTNGELFRRSFPENSDWAYCEWTRVSDDDGHRTVDAAGGTAEVAVRYTEAPDGTRVRFHPSFIGEYGEPGHGTWTRPCNSYGVLEERLRRLVGRAA